MRPTEVVNIPDIKSFLYIFILTTKINSIMRSFFKLQKMLKFKKFSNFFKNDLVVLNETD